MAERLMPATRTTLVLWPRRAPLPPPSRGLPFERTRAIGVAELLFDIDAVERGKGSFLAAVRLLERIERRSKRQPGIRRDAGRRALIIDRVGAGILLDDLDSLSSQPCFFCHSQNTRSTKQWWKKKMGSRPAVSFSPMSPLAPSIGERSLASERHSRRPTDECCYAATRSARPGVRRRWRDFHSTARPTSYWKTPCNSARSGSPDTSSGHGSGSPCRSPRSPRSATR